MSRVQNYFQNYDSPKIKEYCTELLNEAPIDFSSIIQLAQKLTLLDAELKSSNYKQRNFMAENMYGNYVGLLYDNYPEMMHTDAEDRPYVKLAEDVRIYPKKLNEKYLPSNIKTDHVKKLDSQQLSIDDKKIHVLYCGYILTDQIWPNKLKGCYISFVNTYYPSKIEWVLDADDFRKGKIIELPIHVQQIEERLVSAKRNFPATGEAGL
ncbi:MAG: hypothetical protein INR73_12890 [Williamsia sp.]|nr:hypothetical protein [Williamsia sp.]